MGYSFPKPLIDINGKPMIQWVTENINAEAKFIFIVKKADYQKNINDTSESQYQMIKKLELDRESHEELIKYSCDIGMNFISSPFDHKSIDLLDELNIPLYKIPSGEITNLPYLRHIGRMGKPVVMSTGMATIEEVKAAMDVLLEAGVKKDDLTILHCNTEYPTPMEDVNLKAMLTIQNELGVKVGYSDHTLGIEVPVAAVALGASVIEKHFTLDRTLPGPDHAASLEPEELNAMVAAIRNIEKAIGNGEKNPSPSEIKNIDVVRKSIVAGKSIKTGDVFSNENLIVKRPGNGISPMNWDKLIGTRAKREFDRDELIEI